MHLHEALAVQPDFKMAVDNPGVFREARDRERTKAGR